jgi:hypothetical protein
MITSAKEREKEMTKLQIVSGLTVAVAKGIIRGTHFVVTFVVGFCIFSMLVEAFGFSAFSPPLIETVRRDGLAAFATLDMNWSIALPLFLVLIPGILTVEMARRSAAQRKE